MIRHRVHMQVLAAVLVGLVLFQLPAGAQRVDFSREVRSLLSRLQTMGRGYHTEAEWSQLLGEMDDLIAKARVERAWDSIVEINLIKAMMYSDMLNDQQAALTILQDTRRSYDHLNLPNLRKVFVREAEVLSKMGDEAAINRLIEEFKASRYYDPEAYAYSGGQGRDVPLRLVRPHGQGDDSVSVSAMEMYRSRARFAPGKPFPDFQALTMDGRSLSLADLRGKVVLMDFWLQGWAPWMQDLPNLVRTYQAYNPSGFEIVGVCLSPSPQGLDAFLRAYNMTWPQIVGDPTLARKIGIFGECTNFLLDQNGAILARDISGANLTQAVKDALGVK